MLEDKIVFNMEFINAIETLSKDFHTYDEEIGTVYEDDALDDYEWYSGVSKLCIVMDNVVLKKSFCGYVNDYDYDTHEYLDEPEFVDCQVDYANLEYQVYVQACSNEVDMFFAEIVPVGNNIFAQEKCDLILEEYIAKYLDIGDKPAYPEPKLPSYCKANDLEKLYKRIRPSVLSYFIAVYDVKDLKKLERFIIEYDINDIHEGNVGWFGGKLKLFDYCGYCSSTNKKIKEILE